MTFGSLSIIRHSRHLRHSRYLRHSRESGNLTRPLGRPFGVFINECALRTQGLPFAAALPPFALARKWTNGKGLDSRFRGNDGIFARE
ncbi:MAG: hypothetical protein ACR2P4_05720 [Gammaproteobacteria bacterium]